MTASSLPLIVLAVAALLAAGCAEPAKVYEPKKPQAPDGPIVKKLFSEDWNGNVKGFSKGPIRTESMRSCWFYKDLCPFGDSDHYFWLWQYPETNQLVVNLTWTATSDATKRLGMALSYWQWSDDFFGYRDLGYEEGPSMVQKYLNASQGKSLEYMDFRVEVVLTGDAGLVTDQPFLVTVTGYQRMG